jgi:aryl-alcohol dehydrogenase-like predicted oxidoreductase
MLIPGHATPEGTARFRDRFATNLPGHFRESGGLWLSSIGLGTYLGEPTASRDAAYREAILRAVGMGVNVLDSAVNYRHQRSERAIASALSAMIALGSLRRDEIFVATKGGFLPLDTDEPDDPSAYLEEKFIRSGIVRAEEIAAGCHVMSPRYLEDQIEVSRRNLGLEVIDLYYLHNPETQLAEVSRDEFFRRLRAAFGALEKAVSEGKIRAYGTATWNAYRTGMGSNEALSLEEILRVAEEVGGEGHHLRAIQFPFNLAMPEGLTLNTQSSASGSVPVLQIARARNVMVFASASLLQSKLARGLPEDVRSWFPGLHTDAQRAIQFVRSTPGITCALVGMGNPKHVEENLATASLPRLTLEDFRAIFAKS